MLLFIAGAVYGQDTTNISITGRNMPISGFIRQLESKTGFSFIYGKAAFDDQERVSLTLSNVGLSEALSALFKGKNLSWQYREKTVILSRQAPQNSQVTADPAPQYSVAGTVVDPQGNPIEGASVALRGQSRGQGTNSKGQFSFSGIPENAVLVVSSIGYATKQLRLSGQREVRVSLDTLVHEIERVEVVSTGYQDIPKERATGSFVQLDNEILNRVVSTNILDRILNITSSLKPEKAPSRTNISIRGFSTINANAIPLVIVDGFPYSENPDQIALYLNNLNPNDVESITILRDAAAASIWGARAGNGVIVITTKTGTFNKRISVQLNTNLNITEKPKIKKAMIISSADAIAYERSLFENGRYSENDDLFPSLDYFPSIPSAIEVLLAHRRGEITTVELESTLNKFSNHDVRDDINSYILQPSINQQYNINVSGGGDKSSYYGSIGYDQNRSSTRTDNENRLTMRIGNTYRPLKKLEINTFIAYTQSKSNSGSMDYNQLLATGSTKASPYSFLVDSQGSFMHVPNESTYRIPFIDTAQYPKLLDWHYKPLEDMYENKYTYKLNTTRIGGGIKYYLIPTLNIEFRGQYEKMASTNDLYNSEHSYTARDLINSFIFQNGTLVEYPIPIGGILTNVSSYLRSWNVRGQANLNERWKNHTLNAIIGIESSEINAESRRNRIYGYNPSTQIMALTMDFNTLYSRRPLGNWGLGQVPNDVALGGTLNRFINYFGNVGYSYDNRIFYTISGRIDQSNFLGAKANQRYVPLWSSGIAWNLSKEQFYNIRWLPHLKLKVTYGYTGNLNNKATALPVISTSFSNSSYHSFQYSSISSYPNPGLTWEKVKIINYGVDFHINSSQRKWLSGSVEYYVKNGINLIGRITPEATTGTTSYTGNYATMKTQGIDIILNSTNITGKITWASNIIISYNTDKIIEYNQATGISASSLASSVSLPFIGKPLLKVYSFPFGGLDSKNGEPMGYLKDTISDFNTVLQKAEPEDLKFHGSATPRIFGSIINSLTYKSISLSCNVVFKLKYYFKKATINYNNLTNNWGGHSDYSKRWKKPGDELWTTIPALPSSFDQRDFFYANSSVNVLKGDHIRLQDVRLSYNADANLIKNLPFSSAAFFIYVNNIGTIWKLNNAGIDPDLSAPYIPIPRSLALGMNINF